MGPYADGQDPTTDKVGKSKSAAASRHNSNGNDNGNDNGKEPNCCDHP